MDAPLDPLPTDNGLPADLAGRDRNGARHSEAEIRAGIAAAPWDRMQEPVERFDLDLIDLHEMGFAWDQRGYLHAAADWYPHKVASSPPNNMIAEACRHA